jgi:putative glutamine amidotransferase
MMANPIILPAVGASIENYLDLVDGILLTGSYSNIHPKHYGDEKPIDENHLDAARDELTLSLIEKAVEKDVPILGICRGFQELNVAFGGSLHQQVHCQPGLNDHREDKSADLEVQYGLSHNINIRSGGLLSKIWQDTTVDVNSVHGQGINQLGNGLTVEAVADDGLIEAISVPGKPILAVQWHPEWKVTEIPFFQAIFAWFKGQCNYYQSQNK